MSATAAAASVFVRGARAGIGAVQDGKTAQAVPHRPGVFNQGGNIVERPHIIAAGLKRDQEDVRQHEGGPERGRVAPPGVDDDVLELRHLLLHLCPENRPVRVARTGDARRVSRLGPDSDGGLCAALPVTVDQPHVTPGQGAGNREIHGNGGLADAAFCISYGDNHIQSILILKTMLSYRM